MRAVRILGIDPGTVVVGFGCVELRPGPRQTGGGRLLAHRASNLQSGRGAGRTHVVDAGVLRLGSSGVDLGRRLARLLEGLGELIERCRPDEVALEEAFHGRSVQSALRIGEARGVVLAEAVRRGVTVHQFPPARIKRSVAGHGAASKEAVARMATSLLGVGGNLPVDATDALAVALCRIEERRGGTTPIAGS